MARVVVWLQRVAGVVSAKWTIWAAAIDRVGDDDQSASVDVVSPALCVYANKRQTGRTAPTGPVRFLPAGMKSKLVLVWPGRCAVAKTVGIPQ